MMRKVFNDTFPKKAMTSNRLHIPIILATLLLASCSSDDKTLVIRDSDSST